MTGDERIDPTAAAPGADAEAGAEAGPGALALSLAPPHDPAAEPTIPAGLARVRGFVNTRATDGDTVDEGLATPADLAAWLTAQGLIEPGTPLDEADLGDAIEIREALRELLEGNAGHGLRPRALRALDAAAAAAPIAVHFGSDGRATLAPVVGGMPAAIGRILADIATATADGTWARLKACRNDECRWAYYDESRNRSGRWCSMAGCGNRMKGRAYRARGRSGSAALGLTD